MEIDVPQKTEFPIEQLIPLGLIINEIITNSLKYAFNSAKGEIEVKVTKLNDKVIIEVNDNGKGFPKDFDIDKDTNLGMQLIFLLAEQIGGTIKVNHENGVGYRITI